MLGQVHCACPNRNKPNLTIHLFPGSMGTLYIFEPDYQAGNTLSFHANFLFVIVSLQFWHYGKTDDRKLTQATMQEMILLEVHIQSILFQFDVRSQFLAFWFVSLLLHQSHESKFQTFYLWLTSLEDNCQYQQLEI